MRAWEESRVLRGYEAADSRVCVDTRVERRESDRINFEDASIVIKYYITNIKLWKAKQRHLN